MQVARVLRKIGRPLEAAVTYERAEKLARKTPQGADNSLAMLAEIMLGKGLALSQCGTTHAVAAEKAFMVANDMHAHLKKHKRQALGLYNLALHYKQCDIKNSEAERLAQKACSLTNHTGTTSVEAYYLRANIAADNGKKATALVLLSKARMLAKQYYGSVHRRTTTIARKLVF